MPGFRTVTRCARCGQILSQAILEAGTCTKCGTDLHTCAQCTWFDTGRRFECGQPITARVSPKDARNECGFFEARVTVERETGSTSAGPPSAQQTFDDLFK